jgi:hypothetical protein
MEQKSDYDLLSGQGTVSLGLDYFRLELHQLRKRTRIGASQNEFPGNRS